MSHNTGDAAQGGDSTSRAQAQPASTPEPVQDRVRTHDSGQAQMPVIQPSMGEIQRHEAPSAPASRSGDRSPAPTGSGGQQSNIVRIFGDSKRGGRFRLEEKTSGLLVFSDMLLDLREAELPAQAEITVYSLFGDVKIIVPPGVTVRTSGFAIFGDDKVEGTQPDPDGPTLIVHRVIAFGDIKIKTAMPGEQISKRWRWF